MLESLFLGACSIGGAFLHGAITEDALNSNGEKIANAITNTKVANHHVATYNLLDCFYNIIYDKITENYNVDKLKNSYNLLYFTMPKEEKFYPNTKEKLALLKFLHSHDEIKLDRYLDINSPTAISDEFYKKDDYKLGYYENTKIDWGIIRFDYDKNLRYEVCTLSKEPDAKSIEDKINNKFKDKLQLWYLLNKRDRRIFTADYTPFSTRDLFDKIINVLTKHYNYNIKEIQFELVYSCLLSKIV